MHPGLKSWRILVIYAFNLFSIPLLFKTLLAPWERDRAEDAEFDFFERFVFVIFSRVLGLLARTFFILCGLIFTFLVILTFPIFLLIPIKVEEETLASAGSFGSFLSYGSTFVLNKHSQDVANPNGFKLFGKEKALRMISLGLSKDTNRNVLLIGETGVGKTSLIAHLGLLGQSGLSFPGIRHHRVVVLNLENISIEDFDKAMEEAKGAGNVIVVIKNIHLYESLFERLAHYLDVRELGIIGTTDFGSYDQVLKNHTDFISKFEKVLLDGTNEEETLAIMKNYASLKRVKIKQNALEEIVRLSDRLIHNQAQPLKSISILDNLRAVGKTITIEDVRQVVSDKTNMPVGAIGRDEREVLNMLEINMHKNIVGQEEGVKDVAEAMKRLRTGISDPSKPAASFLFLGPTGVGKTYTAKILAESYFGRRDSMIRFDMSEFSMPDSINLFSDRLASVIEENPLSLVFFDELEKSNRAIHHLLLQVLDEGRLTRENGRIASFKDAIIIATSNAGSVHIIENPDINKKILIDILIKENIFAPEFLNRFSSIILFRPLNTSEARKITELMLTDFKERLFVDKGINLIITAELIDKVASAGFDPEFGARPIKRAMEEIVENKVAEYILAGNNKGDLKIL